MDDEKLLQALTGPTAEDPDAMVERVVTRGQASYVEAVVGDDVVDLFGRPIPAGTRVYSHAAARGQFRGTLEVGDEVTFRAGIQNRSVPAEKFVVRRGMVLHIDLMRDYVFIYDSTAADRKALPGVVTASMKTKAYTHMVPHEDIIDATIGGPASYALADVEAWLDGNVR